MDVYWFLLFYRLQHVNKSGAPKKLSLKFTSHSKTQQQPPSFIHFMQNHLYH
uniref:Uncharacterized protein n=1 Tax=Solanum lycopersicum TaxID=4081 RepID=A0A3Q7FHL3_SOLLC